MRKISSKLTAILLAAVLMLSLIPVFGVSAEENVITNEKQLVEAAQNGGEVTVVGNFLISQTVEVRADLTINLNDAYVDELYGGNPSKAMFVVASGVTLTLNGSGNNVRIFPSISTNVFELEANATLITTNCNYDGRTFAVSTAGETDVKPTVTFNGGGAYTTNFVEGSADITVNSGYFRTDISAYAASGSYILEPESEYGSWQIIKLSESYSETFKKFINDEGKFVFNRYDPKEDGDYDFYDSEIYDLLNIGVYNGYFDFRQTEEEKSENKALISYYDFSAGDTEYHLVEYVFNYDPEVYKDAQTVLSTLPKNEKPEEFGYCYKITDLEFLDYLFDQKLGEYNYPYAINYSGYFKKIMGDKPYSIYLCSGMGGGNIYLRDAFGTGMLMRDGVVYGTQEMSSSVEYKMYVPGDTADTNTAKINALQKRLDGIYGKGKVTVKESTLLDIYLWDMFDSYYNLIAEEYKDPNFEAFKNGEYEGFYPALPDPESPDYEKEISEFLNEFFGIENATLETKAFQIEVNGVCHPILIENNKDITIPADPEKEPEKEPEKQPETDNTQSDVALITEDIEAKLEYADDVFPANTVVKVEQQKQGAIVERAQKALGKVAKKIAVFEITAKSDNVTVQPNGKVKVIFDIPENYDPAKTVLYYVSEDGKFERIPLTISSDKKTATAELTHFSTYVLSESVDSPTTGNNNNIMIWLLALSLISGATIIYSNKKIKS